MEGARSKRETLNSKALLFMLPAELRNKIYDLVVTGNMFLTTGNMSSPSQIAVLQVCRKLREELVPLYYGSNTFSFALSTLQHRESACEWLNSLSVEAVNSLRKLWFCTLPSVWM